MYYWPDYAVETEVLDVATLVDGDMTKMCRIVPPQDSTKETPKSNKAFLGVNHFLAQPNADVSQDLNELKAVADRVEACSELNGGSTVNVVSSDFWHLGNIVEFVQRQNQARTVTAV